MLHRRFSGRAILALAVASAACAQPGHNVGSGGGDGGSGGGSEMGPRPPDLSTVDLYGVDFSGIDFSMPGDGNVVTACDVVQQTGCGANEKCTLGAMQANACVSDGTKANGAACGAASSDDCVKGTLCTSEATSLYQCRQVCAADGDCKQPAQPGGPTNVAHCLVGLMGTTAKVCTVACNPVTAAGVSGCAAGLGCQVFGVQATMSQASDCSRVGIGADGADCATNGNGDCSSGFGCVSTTVGATTTKHCRQLCRAGKAGDCTVGGGGYQCALPQGNNLLWGFCCPGGGC